MTNVHEEFVPSAAVEDLITLSNLNEFTMMETIRLRYVLLLCCALLTVQQIRLQLDIYVDWYYIGVCESICTASNLHS